MSKRVKMVDVARVAGVSRTAVSLILNQVPGVRIAHATRERVLQVARDLGYSPGPSLQDLGAARQRLFGVLINEISSAYPIDLLYGLQTWADANGVQILIHATDGIADREALALENLARFGVEGVVYASTFSAIVAPVPALTQFRHVLLNCRRKDGAGTAILPAERHGGALAATHLLDMGRKRLATITGDPWQFASIERLAGFRRVLNKEGLEPGPDHERAGDWSHKSGYAATLELLASGTPPDAIFCQNDLMARGALAAAAGRGLRVPEDLAIIGYDDREFARDMGLSSISLPYAAMAERAMALITGASELGDKTIAVQGQLLARASTAEAAPQQ